MSSKGTGLVTVSRNHHNRSTQGQVNEEPSHWHVAESLYEREMIVQLLNLFYMQVTNGPAVEQKGWPREPQRIS